MLEQQGSEHAVPRAMSCTALPFYSQSPSRCVSECEGTAIEQSPETIEHGAVQSDSQLEERLSRQDMIQKTESNNDTPQNLPDPVITLLADPFDQHLSAMQPGLPTGAPNATTSPLLKPNETDTGEVRCDMEGCTARAVVDKSLPTKHCRSDSCDTLPWSAEQQLPLEKLSSQTLAEKPDPDFVSLLERDSTQQEFEDRWILNMSIRFRDYSDREKFFITYAADTHTWRRMTISVQYHNAPVDSLEADLAELDQQRDKSYCIYDALHDSLPTIHFFDTITNLKLVTDPEDDQLHVHVREDTNEIIEYPASTMFEHIIYPRYTENQLRLHSHISGFVYKVTLDNKMFIRKDIPGRESVDEFMYELNALNKLKGSSNVIELCGLITDNGKRIVKGLLLHYAQGGSLQDILYDQPKAYISRPTRERWACQIIKGLADIHEAGFVQGDFTLSNIVIDDNDDVRIIDINRRGCPLGWEPPELIPMIEAGYRISMYISTKTDLYQLGMVLWALAKHDHDPDQHEFGSVEELEVSVEYQEVVSICLSRNPKHRLSAIQLVSFFSSTIGRSSSQRSAFHFSLPAIGESRSRKASLDSELAPFLDEIYEHQRAATWYMQAPHNANQRDSGHSLDSRANSTHHYQNSAMWSTRGNRGRTRHREDTLMSSRDQTATSDTSLSSLSAREYATEYCPRDAQQTQPHDATRMMLETTGSQAKITMPQHKQDEPCALCYRDSGFEELLSLVPDGHNSITPTDIHAIDIPAES